MSVITLESIKAAHKSIAEMIAAFEAHASRTVTIGKQIVELRQGEHYAGIILGADGLPSHHLILLDGDADEVTWAEAKNFAAEAGGELPSRAEQSLLFANLKSQFESAWYWSSEQHAAFDDCAWRQVFSFGHQVYSFKSARLRARAVRRLTIQ